MNAHPTADGPTAPAQGLTRGLHTALAARAVVHPAVTIVAWTCLVVFALGSIGTALIGRSVFLGTDLLSLVAPWNSTLQLNEVFTNTLLGDTFDSAVPQTALITDSLSTGTLAQWNPYQSGGSELGGLPNSGVYSPLSLPWWILPLSYAPGAVKLLEIVAIAVGMSLFLRRLRLPSASWAVASLVFASSGFMISWTNWPQTRVAAFIPLLFWALDRAAVRRRVVDAVPVGLVLASMLLGGFPAIVGYALYAGGAYIVVRAIVDARTFRAVVKSCVVNLLGIVVAFLIAAWQLIPFAMNASALIDFDTRVQNPNIHLPWDALATAFIPGIVGTPGGSNFWGSRYNAIEAFTYVGTAAVVLVVAAFVVRGSYRMSRMPAIFSGLALLVCVLLVFVGGPFLEIAQEFPIFDSNPVLRLRVLIGFFAAVLAAYGFTLLLAAVPASEAVASLREKSRARQIATALVGLVVVALTLAAVYLVRQTLYLAPAEKIDQARTETIVMFVVGLTAVVVAAGAWIARSGVYKVVAGVVIPVLIVGPALVVTDLWWPKSTTESFYPMTPTHEYLTENLGTQRFSPVGGVTFPGTNSYYRLRSLGGHNFHTAEWKDLMREIDPDAFLSATYSVLPPGTIDATATAPMLDRLAVQYLVQDPGAQGIGVQEAGEPGTHAVDLASGTEIGSGLYTGPVRAVVLTIGEQLVPGPEGVTLGIDIRDEATGATLAETSTWVKTAGGARGFAVQGEEIPESTEWRAYLTIDGIVQPARPLVTDEEALAINLSRPRDDGLSIVHTGDATIYERAGVLDRVRWAPKSMVIEDSEARVAAMNDEATPRDAVILEHEADDRQVSGTSSASLEDTSRSDNEVRMEVSADGAGWVIFEDSLRRPGWTATVDGVEVPLVDAEHAAGAVFVETGEHTVLISYETPGRRVGLIVTTTTVLLLLVASTITLVLRRRSTHDPVEPGEKARVSEED